MNKVLTLAVAVLVLSVSTALPEPPMALTENDTFGIGHYATGVLADGEMTLLVGTSAQAAGCTAAIERAGQFVTVIGNAIGHNGLVRLGSLAPIIAGAVCV